MTTDTQIQGETLEMPERIYIPHGPAMLMAISPELQNNEGAWYVRESERGDFEDLETAAPPDFKWPKPTLAGYDYALSMAELNGFDNVTHAIITAVRLRDTRAAVAGPPGDALVDVLRKLSDQFNGADNGYCTICRQRRLYDTHGKVQPCENVDCLSHRISNILERYGERKS